MEVFEDQCDTTYYLQKYLKQWNSFTSVHVGQSRSGKTYSLRSMLTPILKEFDFILVFSKTISNGQYQSWLKTKLLYDDFKPEIIHKFRDIVVKYRKPTKAHPKGKVVRCLVIIDDCISNNFRYQEEILNLYFTGRHFNMSTCVLTQKCSMLGQALLCNTLIFCILFCGSLKEKKYISENIIADALDSYTKGENSLNDLVRKGYALQTDVCLDYNSIIVLPLEKDKIFTYKAPAKI